MTRRFNSFKEIDEQLKILTLKREIDKECAKLRIRDIKTRFYPMNLIRGADGALSRVMVPFVLTRLIKRIKSHKEHD